MARSDDESSDSSSSSSEDSEERRRREKKERKRKREKKDKKRREKKEHKERKDKKKDKDKKKRGRETESLRATASGSTWGKHGIIKEADYHDKQEEFLAWLSEVKGVQQEALGPRETKEHFSTFCEDYNTATLPSDKYYNLRTWYLNDQHRKAKEAAMADANNGGGFERSSFDDEAERKRDLQRQRAMREDGISRVMAKAMREGEGLVQDMREQEAAKLHMRAAYQTGHVDKARNMAEKLDPKYVSPEEMKKIFGGPAPLNSKKPGGMGGGH